VHAVRLEYSSGGGPIDVELLWARGRGHTLSSLAGPVVSPRKPTPWESVVRSAAAVGRTVVIAAWELGFLVLLIACGIAPAARAMVRHHSAEPIPLAMLVVLGASAVLFVVAIAWGVPGIGWAPDELIPMDLFDAIDRRFSFGWWSKYPPLHFYVCTLAALPLLVWRWLDPVAFAASLGPQLVWLTFRFVSVAMALGTVLMVYLTGRYVYGRGSATVAAALSALTMPMVYHAKIANVDLPYVFWFSVSLASFVRILIDDSAIDYVLFSLTATLAICTKDQAYGLYALPALALVALAYSRANGESFPARIKTLLTSRRLVTAVAISVATFALCHNLLLNAAGFASHVRYITGTGSVPYRMFEPTVSGQWRLLNAAGMLARVSFGWPAFLICVAGVGWSLWRPGAAQRRLWWLMLPAISYYMAFVALVGFTYDRFLLPIFLSLALAGGFVVSRVEQMPARARTWCRIAIGGALAYSILYVAGVDAVMRNDSRYTVEAWIRTHVEPGATFGRIGPIEHVPRLYGFVTQLVDATPEGIRTAPVDYLVVNADWVERFETNRLEHDGWRDLRAGRLGFQEVFEARPRVRFAGMTFDARFDAFGSTGYSTLTRIDPRTVVYKRTPINPGTPAPTARTP